MLGPACLNGISKGRGGAGHIASWGVLNYIIYPGPSSCILGCNYLITKQIGGGANGWNYHNTN